MKYYININSWNLLETFATESISPFAFYNKRNFGNNLSRYINSSNDKINFLILATTDNGGDYTIEVDDSILDKTSIKPVKDLKTYFTYDKTIYFKVGYVSFRFANQSLLDDLMAESQILSEVKCIDKYKSSFLIKEIKEQKASIGLQRIGESFSFEQYDFIEKDNNFNLIKGAIVGYVRGELTASGSDDQTLTSMIRDIKNSFAGLHTQIMVNDVDVKTQNDYINKLAECKKLFNIVRKEKTNNFEIISQLFAEIIKLSSLRSSELALYKSNEWELEYEKLIHQKQELEDSICKIEIDSNILSIKNELEQIKKQERLMGKAQGKTRVYYKKGTPEYERKNHIKSLLKDFEEHNEHYKSLNRELDNINQKIINSTSGKTQYDNAISAIFTRVSDIINDLQKLFETGKKLNVVDLTHIKYYSEGYIQLEDIHNSVSEIEFFNVLLNVIIERDTLDPISDSLILSLVEEAANKYKTCSTATSDNGTKIITCLRDFWKYKNNKIDGFEIPEDMPILQSIMSFFIKPFGFEQIERYMLNKKYTEKKYAMMLWGACNGYANIPKTFTAILYQNPSTYEEMDNMLHEIIYTDRIN